MGIERGAKVSELTGKIIKEIQGLEKESEEVVIITECGHKYKFYHRQNCCESVALNDFEGEASDLIGGLIVSAEEVEGVGEEPRVHADSYTWTFYKIETNKGGLWMRWLGESNGYYSEEVDISVSKVG